MTGAPIKQPLPANVQAVLARLENIGKVLPIAGVILTRDRKHGWEFLVGFDVDVPTSELANIIEECGRYFVSIANKMRSNNPQA